VGVIEKAMDPLSYKVLLSPIKYKVFAKFPGGYKNFKNLTYIKTNFIVTK